MTEANPGERLQKLLSQAGVASRRQAESMILAGRVSVNGEVIKELGRRARPGLDTVRVDGSVVHLDGDRRYLVFHKPTKMVTSLSDDRNRTDLRGVIAEIGERVFPVGRLDYDTSGLLILTNDGEAAQVLAHPSFGVEKSYLATVRGRVTASTLRTLRTGVVLEDGSISADDAKLVGEPQPDRSNIEITLHSGRNRIVRRMCDAVGHPVIALKRRRFGPFRLDGLKPGEFRDFSSSERHQLATLVAAAKNTLDEGK